MKKEINICCNCHYLGNQNEKYCPHCGRILISKCSHCGAKIRTPFAEYCSVCGKTLIDEEIDLKTS
ncbi:MAG: hypothetical protein APR63_01240 [Desulfuromonas sp. SDB]|nr:MAG: hypothetical protein APR63_01240 [Desulfuromonas sp. SDB]